jgi:CheY-like chemotaxis protein
MAHVLLVDDEADVLHVFGRFLESGGHTITYGQPGAALRFALEQVPYDIVVTDMSMPDFDGEAIAEWVSQHRPGVPVIAVTGNPMRSDGHGLHRFSTVLVKPIGREHLLSAVTRALDEGRLTR